MTIIDKWQTLFILLSILLGLALGQIDFIEANAGLLIIPAMSAMLYGLFLSVSLKDLGKAFKNKRFAVASLAVNFLWTPMLVWGLGSLLLANHPFIWIGFLMLMVTPCTDWYLIFTQITKGNVALSTSILPLNLILQLLLLPLYLFIFSGVTGQIDLSGLWWSIMIIIVIPFLLSRITGSKWLNQKRKTPLNQLFGPIFSKGQLFFLCFAIFAMFASEGGYLLKHPEMLYLMFLPVMGFYIINFLISQMLGKSLGLRYPERVSLTMTTLARNSPLALAIALTAFPDQPLVGLALIIGPLIELPILAGVSQILLLKKRKL